MTGRRQHKHRARCRRKGEAGEGACTHTRHLDVYVRAGLHPPRLPALLLMLGGGRHSPAGGKAQRLQAGQVGGLVQQALVVRPVVGGGPLVEAGS